jgi:hypothetical protein
VGEQRPKRRAKGGSALPTTLGGIIAGFDQQVFRTTPPPHELVRKGQAVRGISGEGPGGLVVELPPTVDPGMDPEPG